MALRLAFLFFLLSSITACRPQTESYSQRCELLDNQFCSSKTICDTDAAPYIVFFVDARHLDYTNCATLTKTIATHKRRDVGHAWIYLEGNVNGKRVFIEGGHSGELGIVQARYFDGIMNYIDYGYANPTKEQFLCSRHEPNPIKYLWENLNDGFFQEGNGNHRPTFAAKVELTEEQFHRIFNYITQCYDFGTYALTGNQCSSFVAQVAALADLHLDSEITMKIEQRIHFNGAKMRLWQDPAYQELTFSTPDVLERSLMQAVRNGKATYAMKKMRTLL